MKIGKFKLFYCLILFVSILTTQRSYAQKYRLIEGDLFLGSGLVIGGDSVVDGPLILGYEPRVNLGNKVSMSVRVEIGLVGIENEFEIFTSSFSSLELFGDYYLINKKDNRLFVGLGAGMMGPPQGSNSFGVSPRIGCELGIMRVSLTYNQMPFYERKVPKYIGITFGITIGGRWKD